MNAQLMSIGEPRHTRVQIKHLLYPQPCTQIPRAFFNCRPTEDKKSSLAGKLLKELAPTPPNSSQKVSIIGVGSVGMACAISILAQGVSTDLAFMDVNADRLLGETLDTQHGSHFIGNAKITSGTDYDVTADSRICVITGGARQEVGETRLDLVQRNVEILKCMIPPLIACSPNTIILMVTNPVDILTYVAWKLSGLPKNFCIGAGTTLDSARFKFLLGKRLNVAPSSVHGWIIGEHGDSSVAVWSGVNVAGVRLRDINPAIGTDKDPENWNEIHKQVVQSAYEIIKAKLYTNWAIGFCVSSICRAILTNSSSVHAVSTLVQGEHGIDKEVYLALPCVVNSCGVTSIVRQNLDPDELAKFQNSAKVIHEVQSSLKI